MHKHYSKVLRSSTLNKVVKRVKILNIDSKQKRHFTSTGKSFFNGILGRYLLYCIIKDVKNTDVFDKFKNPVIDHAFFLLKTSNGPATPLHQDRPFWLEKENEPASMLTLWFACYDINSKNGCLIVPLDSTLSQGKILKYIKNEKSEGNFEYEIKDFQKELKKIEMKGGDLLIFDSYEPHASTPNDSEFPRLAFKIVIGEKNKFIDQHDRIEILNLMKYSIFYFPLKKLNFFKL